MKVHFILYIITGCLNYFTFYCFILNLDKIVSVNDYNMKITDCVRQNLNIGHLSLNSHNILSVLE